MRRKDGGIALRAIPPALTFSPGGKAPLVRLAEGGKAIALTWPGTLPTPAVSGDTATYREVLRGVDLVMRAEAKGYAQRLVIKNLDAANSALYQPTQSTVVIPQAEAQLAGTYDTRRLKRHVVDAEVYRPMQADVTYGYDPVGNITSIADRTIDRPADVHCFRHDYLRRLTEAWTPGNGCTTDPRTAVLSGPAPYRRQESRALPAELGRPLCGDFISPPTICCGSG